MRYRDIFTRIRPIIYLETCMVSPALILVKRWRFNSLRPTSAWYTPQRGVLQTVDLLETLPTLMSQQFKVCQQ